MSLKEEIAKIVQLQEIDVQIHSLTQEKDIEIPAQLEHIQKSLEQNRQRLAASEEKMKDVQLRKKESELELASKEEALRKAQGQLYQLKTNKEYQAKLTEIGSIKADISLAEESVIEILDEIEAAKEGLDKEKSKMQTEEASLKAREDGIRARIADIDIQIRNLEDKRKIFSRDIDANILDKYERLLKTRQGLAIVPVKDNNCGACHMTVTHQKINEIKMYTDLVFCDNCVRALYIPEDIQ
jgi:hypothetical protein